MSALNIEPISQETESPESCPELDDELFDSLGQTVDVLNSCYEVDNNATSASEAKPRNPQEANKSGRSRDSKRARSRSPNRRRNSPLRTDLRRLPLRSYFGRLRLRKSKLARWKLAVSEKRATKKTVIPSPPPSIVEFVLPTPPPPPVLTPIEPLVVVPMPMIVDECKPPEIDDHTRFIEIRKKAFPVKRKGNLEFLDRLRQISDQTSKKEAEAEMIMKRKQESEKSEMAEKEENLPGPSELKRRRWDCKEQTNTVRVEQIKTIGVTPTVMVIQGLKRANVSLPQTVQQTAAHGIQANPSHIALTKKPELTKSQSLERAYVPLPQLVQQTLTLRIQANPVHIFMVIIPTDYPVSIINLESYKEIRELLSIAMEHHCRGSEPGFNININQIVPKQGVVQVICGNVESADWLRLAMSQLKRNLECKPLEEVQLLPSFIIWVPRKDDFEEVKRALEAQGTRTSNWIHIINFARMLETQQGRKFLFLGDKELAGKFEGREVLTMCYKRNKKGAKIQFLKGIEDHPAYILSLQSKKQQDEAREALTKKPEQTKSQSLERANVSLPQPVQQTATHEIQANPVDIFMVIKTTDYPVSTICLERYKVIRELLSIVMELYCRSEPGFNINFKKIEPKQGVVEVICGNVESADWLRLAVSELDRNLECKPLEEVQLLPSFIIWVYGRNDDFEEVKRALEEQGTRTSNWIHIMTYDGRLETQQGRKFLFLGDKELAQKCKRTNSLTMCYKQEQQKGGRNPGVRIEYLRGFEDHSLSSPLYIDSATKQRNETPAYIAFIDAAKKQRDETREALTKKPEPTKSQCLERAYVPLPQPVQQTAAHGIQARPLHIALTKKPELTKSNSLKRANVSLPQPVQQTATHGIQARPLLIHMVIIPTNYPVSIISIESYKEIGKLLSIVMEHYCRSEPGFNINIKRIEPKQGVIEVICGNVESADWLRLAVSELNRNLECKPLEEVKLLPSFIIWVYERNDDFEEVKRALEAQGTRTSNWIHIMTYDGMLERRQGRKFLFLGEKELAEKFKRGKQLTMGYKRKQQRGKDPGARIQFLKGFEDYAARTVPVQSKKQQDEAREALTKKPKVTKSKSIKRANVSLPQPVQQTATHEIQADPLHILMVIIPTDYPASIIRYESYKRIEDEISYLMNLHIISESSLNIDIINFELKQGAIGVNCGNFETVNWLESHVKEFNLNMEFKSIVEVQLLPAFKIWVSDPEADFKEVLVFFGKIGMRTEEWIHMMTNDGTPGREGRMFHFLGDNELKKTFKGRKTLQVPYKESPKRAHIRHLGAIGKSYTKEHWSKKKQEEAREALEAKISETQTSRMLRDENLQLNECDMCKGRHITANCSLKCDTNGPALLLPKAWEMLEPPKAIPLQQPDAESKTSDCKKKCRNKSKKKKKSRKKRNQLVDARKKAQTQQKRNAKCKKTLYSI